MISALNNITLNKIKKKKDKTELRKTNISSPNKYKNEEPVYFKVPYLSISNLNPNTKSVKFGTTVSATKEIYHNCYFTRPDFNAIALAQYLKKNHPEGDIKLIFHVAGDGSEAVSALLGLKHEFKSLSRFKIEVRDIYTHLLDQLKEGRIGLQGKSVTHLDNNSILSLDEEELDSLKKIYPNLPIDDLFKRISDIPIEREELGCIADSTSYKAVAKVYEDIWEYEIPKPLVSYLNIKKADVISDSHKFNSLLPDTLVPETYKAEIPISNGNIPDNFDECAGTTVLVLRNFVHLIDPKYVEPIFCNYEKKLSPGSLLILGQSETDKSLSAVGYKDNIIKLMRKHFEEIPEISNGKKYRAFKKLSQEEIKERKKK